MNLEYVDYILVRSTNPIRTCIYYSYIQLTLGDLGGVKIPTLFIRIPVHPDTIHRKHCPSLYYLLKILFVAALALKVLTIFTLFLLCVLALFIICSNVNFFFFSKCIPMKVR